LQNFQKIGKYYMVRFHTDSIDSFSKKRKNMKKAFFAIVASALALGAFPAIAQAPAIESVCVVTDVGRINDGTFNQYAYEGMIRATEEFDLDDNYIETVSETDYANNINTCIQGGADIVITVGFLLADATTLAAEENPGVYFIGVDQFLVDGPTNFVGVQFREDQAGFLVGALAALVSAENGFDTVAGVYGVEIPPVVKFRNGYEQGVRYINPDLTILGTYIDSFVAPDRGAQVAEQFIGEGAGVIFGAGGPTGSGGIRAAAQAGVYVIGVDQDEYFTTFGGGETEGAEFLITSALKRVDVGVYTLIAALVNGEMDAFPGGSNFVLEIANDGIDIGPKHDSDVPDEIYEQVTEIREMLGSGELETGVDPVSGALLSEMEMEMTPEATPGS
jgi:basic membrane protein A and related proteins